MIRKASGTSASGDAAAQAGASVAGTAIKEGSSLAASFLSGGLTNVINAVTGMFSKGMETLAGITINRDNKDAEMVNNYWLTRNDRNTKTDNNMGFYIIVGLAIVAALVIILVNNKKSK